MKQIHLLLTAFGFFTRIPVPFKIAFSQDNLNKCNRYLPIVGYVVGGISALVFWGTSLVFPQSIAVILSMMTSVLLTGAFHEDGFADVCDAFGGGWTKEKILFIMKDSRVGAYGAIGILLLLLLKFFSTNEIPSSTIAVAIIIGHVISRTMAVWTMHTLNYVREDESSKSKPITKALKIKDLLIAFIIAAPTFLLLGNNVFLLILAPALVAKLWMEHYFKKWIGGYTGDCLGSIQQVSEVVIYLSIIAINNYNTYENSFEAQLNSIF
ncbi:adenosylcobinamide-GDP ribazoletransferase [Carboxylicivirga marina]|uniref:adenosylcobinamide-GDP ribazoletransferase n=1 Tax=Carboxylicivirga marina TaxID=2800988 RepID=UPI00259A139C|nr:adenosylcobinamide-GDP ribazoletransferase [uncultured Carboxylicivirga sp.]